MALLNHQENIMTEIQFNELKEKLIGLKIEDVKSSMTSSDEVFSLTLTLSDGTSISMEPTTYNYGGQNLVIEHQ